MHACTHTYNILHTDTHINTQTQVGLRSLVCQFVVPLVPSQEAHRQASSHAWTGTGPYTNTVVPGATVHCVCVCVFIFLQSQETNAEKLGACEKTPHCSRFHTRKMERFKYVCMVVVHTQISEGMTSLWLFHTTVACIYLFIYWQISKCRDKQCQSGTNLTK